MPGAHVRLPCFRLTANRAPHLPISNMNTEIPKDLKKWEITRQKGKPRFILLSGVLGYGLPMFVVMTFFVNRQQDKPITPAMIAISAVVWAIGGASFGLIMWAITERRYQKFLAKQKNR